MAFCTACGQDNSAEARFCAGCGAAVAPAQAPGDGTYAVGTVIGGGRYRIDSVLGVGGMGFVYKATDVSLGRVVALKLLRSELSNHPTARRRMEQEARALARIEHANVVQVRSIFEEEGLLAMELEYIPGGDLGDRIESGELTSAEAVRLTAGMLAGLQAIHDAGLIHRDIKPQNVLLTAGGVPKVTDLGVARDPEAKEKTRLGSQLGTPAYMAPEQIQAVAIDHRVDIYAAGIVLYELLSGQLPYDAQSDFDWAVAHVQQPPDLAVLDGRCPAPVKAVVARALAKDPGQRWQSAMEMAQALAATLPDGSTTSGGHAAAPGSPPVEAPPSAPASGPVQTADDDDDLALPAAAPKSIGLIAAVVAGLSLVLIVGLWMLVGRSDSPTGADVDPGGGVVDKTDDPPATKPTVDLWCQQAKRFDGPWRVTSQVWGKQTRGHYALRFAFSGDLSNCGLTAHVERIGYTVKRGPLRSQERAGQADVQRPAEGTLGMMVTNLQLESPGKKLRVRFFFRPQNGELTGLWMYDQHSWKAGFFGPLRITRGSAGFPDLEGVDGITHAARCVPMFCDFGPDGSGEVSWRRCGSSFQRCVASSR